MTSSGAGWPARGPDLVSRILSWPRHSRRRPSARVPRRGAAARSRRGLARLPAPPGAASGEARGTARSAGRECASGSSSSSWSSSPQSSRRGRSARSSASSACSAGAGVRRRVAAGKLRARRARLRRRHRRARDRDHRHRGCSRRTSGRRRSSGRTSSGSSSRRSPLGYWLGGRLADRRPEPALLGRIVLGAAIFVALDPVRGEAVPRLHRPGSRQGVGRSGRSGASSPSCSCCAPPVVLLGMVSPFAIRLAVSSIATAGAVAGRLYALSTAGSLLGTFLPALVLIPAIGTQRTFLVVAAVARGSSCFLLGPRYLVVPAALAVLLVVPPGAIKGEDGLIHEETSRYQYIGVVQRQDGAPCPPSQRRGRDPLAVAAGLGADRRGMGRAPRRPAAPRTAARARRDPRQRGRHDGAGARRLLPGRCRRRRRARPRGEPRRAASTSGWGTTRASRCTTPMRVPFLRSTDARYDLIVVDAYRQPYVPFYLATREFFRLVREHLTPGGIVALNVAAVPDDKRLVAGRGRDARGGVPPGARVAGAPLQHVRARPDAAALAAGACAAARGRPARPRAAASAPRPRRALRLSRRRVRGRTTARRSSG